MINERFKLLRKALNLNQSDFGEKLGVSRSVIVNIELNRVEPKELFLNHACEVFDVNHDWLINGIGNIFNKDTINNKNLEEINNIFEDLKPELQDYVLLQIRELLEIQKSLKN